MGARRWAFFSSLLGWALIVALAVSRIRQDLTSEQALSHDLTIALDQVRELKGLLRICAWCKKIRNDEDAWAQPEDYLSQHTHAEFTHGICPACKEKFLRER